jgi:hypothetical protein
MLPAIRVLDRQVRPQPKQKRLICIEPEKQWFLRINSPSKYKPNHPIAKDDCDFLDHDSFVELRQLTVEGAEDTAKRQLRAYMCLGKSELSDARENPKATVEIVNAGQTPAYEVQGRIRIRVGNVPLGIVALVGNPLSPPLESKGLSGPNRKTVFSGRMNNPVTEEQWEGIASEGMALYVVGYLEYRDVFHRKYHLGIKLAAGGPYNDIGDGRWTVCEDGNEEVEIKE